MVGGVITGDSNSEYSNDDNLPYEIDSPSTKHKKTTNKNTMTYHTNLYVEQFFEANLEQLSVKSWMRKFVGGIDIDRMLLFLALTYYMGLIKKSLI